MYHKVFVNNSTKPYILDDEGLELFDKYTWFATSGDYPYLRTKIRRNGTEVILKLHIELMTDDILKEMTYSNRRIVVDHIDGNIYDNRKSNLRVVTQSENNMNKKIQENNTSGVVGVSWHSRDKVWNAYISVNNKSLSLGYFYHFRNAVKARVKAEDKYFGNHAYRHRDDEYNYYINTILNLPHMIEPIIKSRPNNKFGMIGIKEVINKNSVKFVAYFYNSDSKKSKSKVFDDFDSAVKWRKNEEIKHYGREIVYRDEIVKREI